MKNFILASAFALLQSVIAVAPGKAAPGTPALGCSTSYDGSFTISIANTESAAIKAKRQAIMLTMTLQDGVLTDSEGRTGYIASNRQFQFDLFNGQAGTIYNSGFSVCPNQTLALQSAYWWGCLSGEFRNLYDKTQGKQCVEYYLLTTPVSGTGPIPGATSVLTGSSSSGNSGSSGTDHTDITSTAVSHNGSPSTTRRDPAQATPSEPLSVTTKVSPTHSSAPLPPIAHPHNANVTGTGSGSGSGPGSTGSQGNGGSGPTNTGSSPPGETSPAPSEGGNGAATLASSSLLGMAAAIAYAILV